VLYCEGEDERVLRAVQTVIEEGLAKPVVVGRPEVIEMRIERSGLKIKPGVDFELVNPTSDSRYKELWGEYHKIMGRRGVTQDLAKQLIRSDPTLIGTMLLRRGDVDAVLCGTVGRHNMHLKHVSDVIGMEEGAHCMAAMNLLMLPSHTLFVCDTYVNEDPSAELLAEITLMAAEEVRRFGLTPKVALLSHSNFGSMNSCSAQKMSRTRELIAEKNPSLEVDGEMHADAALDESTRQRLFPDSVLKGSANLLIMPNLDAANIAFNLLKTVASGGITVGPILLGAAKPVHILTPTASVRRLINMTALAVVDANHHQSKAK